MPKGLKKARRDNTDFTQYAKGGEVWSKPRPSSLGDPVKLSPKKKAKAKAMAKSAGRPYPNLVDKTFSPTQFHESTMSLCIYVLQLCFYLPKKPISYAYSKYSYNT